MKAFTQFGSFTMAYSITHDTTFQKFHTPDGYIAYQDTHGIRIFIGDPICPMEARKKLITAFIKESSLSNRSVFGLQASFETAAIYHSLGYHATHMGVETHILSTWSITGKKVGRRIRKAFKKGLIVQEASWGSSPDLRKSAMDISTNWMATRKTTKPLNLLLREPDFMDRPYERTFFAWMPSENGKKELVGYVTFEALCSDDHCIGWYANINRRDDSWNIAIFDAIIHTAFETFTREPHFQRLSLGLAPLSYMSNPFGFHNPLVAWMNRMGYAFANDVYNYQGIFQSKKAYWPKHLHTEKPEVEAMDTYCIGTGRVPFIKAVHVFMAVGILPEGLLATTLFGMRILANGIRTHYGKILKAKTHQLGLHLRSLFGGVTTKLR
ncbi:MAG: DUF2156 domain-containing protein [Desulfobacterales bacterium]|nr:DUF2156 domain-containing protein [Desulfobacterales bacterium]